MRTVGGVLAVVAVLLAGCATPGTPANLSTDPAEVRDACLPEPDVGACLEAHTLAVLRARGPGPAVTLLEGLAADPATAGHAHHVAHGLGHALLEREGGDVTSAASLCPITMGSGCLHGVVEAYLSEAGAQADVGRVCALGPGTTPHVVHQCQHGVGHGLRMAIADPVAAAGRCVNMPDFDGRVNCASGVFMENVVGADAQRVHPDDPAFPCSALDRLDLRVGCWQMQPSLVVASTGNLSRAAAVCAHAGPVALACESGFGQVAASHERRSGVPAETTCELAPNQTAGENCLRGAVQDIVTQAADVRPGLERCTRVVAAVQGVCYRAVGDIHVALQPDRATREAACAAVPSTHVAACVDGSRAR